MTNNLSQNSQAILLLTAPLIVGRVSESYDLLTPGEYNRLARFLRENRKQPGDLIGSAAPETIKACAAVIARERLETLLGRGFLLSQAVERWTARSIWVSGRADGAYPRRLKSRLKEDAPPLLYGCGDSRLLEAGGLAIVGSRHVDEELLEFSENVGRIAAAAGKAVVSGGAKGVDRSAMSGALAAGGIAVGVLADSLERASLARDNRESLMDRKLVLVSPYDPAAGFNVGHAMQRNKIVYALSDAGLVVNSDFQKGGTWAGAIEQLEKLRFVPVFVRNGAKVGLGNQALLQRGGLRWPEPTAGPELAAALTSLSDEMPVVPKQEMLALKEEAPHYGSAISKTDSTALPAQEKSEKLLEVTPVALAQAERLFAAVRSFFEAELKNEKTEAEIVELFGITKAQTKAWLKRLLDEGVLAEVGKSKPARYRLIERLL